MSRVTSETRADAGTCAQVRPLDLGPVIIRVAGWPIETVDKIRSPHLAEGVDRWLEQEEIVRLASARLSQSLHALVPTIRDGILRAAVLSFRRCIYRSVDPLPDSLTELLISSNTVPPDLKESICRQSEVRVALAAERRELELAYESSRVAEQDELRRIAGDPAFRKALYVASPRAFEALLKAESNGERGQQGRKLDLTLHSYIVRAVGRATPNGLWAGVAIETPPDGSEASIWTDRASGRVLFSPDLSPFVKALRAMARQDPWRKEIPLRLNPTLFRSAPSAWQFGNYQEGTWEVFQTADHTLLADLLSLFFDASTMLPREIQNHLVARNADLSEVEAGRFMDQALEAGILWSTLDLPSIYDDPWHALEGALSRVPVRERPHWDTCLRALKRICRRLSLDCWAMSLEDLQEHMVAARKCVNELLVRHRVPLVPGGMHVLFADMSAPFRFSVSAGLRSKIERALCAYWAFDRYGMGKIQGAIDRQKEFGKLLSGEDLPVVEFVRRKEAAGIQASRESPTHSAKRSEQAAEEIDRPAALGLSVDPWEAVLHTIDEPSIEARARGGFRRWYQELDAVFAHRRHQLRMRIIDDTESPLAPGSALVLLDVAGQDCSLRIGSVTPDPCLFYSRFTPLFAEENGERIDRFSKWYRESLRSTEVFFPDLQFADLGIRAEINPNAAIRPRMARYVLDGLDQGDGLLASIRIHFDTAGRPRLYVPGHCSAVLPGLNSAVSLDGLDPYSRCLHDVSHLLGRSSLMRPLPRFSAEIDRYHHLPRLYLDETTVIGPERWTPPRSVAEELAGRSGLDRYIVWRRFVGSARLPKLVYGKYGSHHTETLIAIDSVLAVENLGRTLAAYGGVFLLQEAFPSPDGSWLRDDDGRHYVAELAIAWQGESAFWKDYFSGQVQTAAQTEV